MADEELKPLAQARTPAVNALVSVEQQRAIAEVQARMIIARSSPRDAAAAKARILEDCRRPELAAEALYEYVRGGSQISGPSIRLAECLAQNWGNIASGIKEISRGDGFSEVVAYAWDLETGYYDERQFQLKHWRDTKGGGYRLKDERDVYELIANMAQRRKRAVIMSVIPGDVREAAIEQCEKTLREAVDCSEAGIKKMLAAFESIGVKQQELERFIGHKVSAIKPANMVRLRKIYVSIRDGASASGDWFTAPPVAEPPAPKPNGAPPRDAPQTDRKMAPADVWAEEPKAAEPEAVAAPAAFGDDIDFG